MIQRPIHPAGLSYAQAHEVTGASRLLWISGQPPETSDGTVPGDFAGQCRLVWSRIEAQLHAAGMTLDHLVKVTTFLSDRRYGTDNASIRHEVLGPRRPALTVVVTGLFEAGWMVEIEAMAAA